MKFFVSYKIEQAQTIHTDVYNNNEVFEKFRQKIFVHTWQFIGNTGLISESENLYPFHFIDHFIEEPLLLSRDKEGEITCLSNVCTHRGNILVYEPCKSFQGIICKYHGRRFKLDGTFQSMPEFKEVENFPGENDHLKKLPLFNWKNLLFTSCTDYFDPLELLKPMMDRLSWMPVEKFKYRKDLSKNYRVNANWALYCENYLEGFHIPFVHEDLNAVIDYGTYETIPQDYTVLQIGYSNNKDDCFILPKESIDYGKNIAAYYYWIFPNMMFNFYPWGLSVNIVKPISVDRTEVTFLVYMWNESKYNHGAGGGLDKVELEDEEVVENVQKGVKSMFYQHGRYSVTREQGTHHFHRLLSKFLLYNE